MCGYTYLAIGLLSTALAVASLFIGMIGIELSSDRMFSYATLACLMFVGIALFAALWLSVEFVMSWQR